MRKSLKTMSLALSAFLTAGALGSCENTNNPKIADKTNELTPSPTQELSIIGGGNKKPNIMLILADDQSYHLSYAGTPGIQTPNLDGLAQDGVFFTDAFSSCASCSPSRSSILTGMYPHSNGHWRNTITPNLGDPAKEFGRESTKLDSVGVHEDIPTLIEILKENGYVTGITEKWHLSPHWKFPFDYRLQSARLPVGKSGQVVKSFLDDIKEDGNPFFLMVNIGNTHRNWLTGIDSRYKVDPANVTLPAGFPDIPDVRKDYANYLSTVQSLDATVKTVIKSLQESGEFENTIIIYTSDQGYGYARAKASVYYDGTHVPLSISGPGIQKGIKTDELASLIDLTPTILDCIGVKIPENVQGISLRPIIEGKENAKGRDLVFTEHNSHGPNEVYPSRAVTDGKILYIRNLMPELKYKLPADLFGKDWGNLAYDAIVKAKDEYPVEYELMVSIFNRPAEELYDISKDPGQMNNLVNDPDYKDILKDMQEALDKWMEDTYDPGDPKKIIRRTDS